MILRPLPPRFPETRDALHQIAFFALGPARYQAEGRMGLQAAPGGFGTPEFAGRVLRVEGETIVHEEVDKIATQTLSTVRAATRFAGVRYDEEWFDGFRDPPSPMDPDLELEIDDTAARALGQWFNFAFDVLHELSQTVGPGDEAGEVQLWPEHFDPAIELGNQRGLRASYGASPGDGAHPEPYLYVSAWSEIDRSNPYWNDESFNGSSLGYGELLSADDPGEAAFAFLSEGYATIHSP